MERLIALYTDPQRQHKASLKVNYTSYYHRLTVDKKQTYLLVKTRYMAQKLLPPILVKMHLTGCATILEQLNSYSEFKAVQTSIRHQNKVSNKLYYRQCDVAIGNITTLLQKNMEVKPKFDLLITTLILLVNIAERVYDDGFEAKNSLLDDIIAMLLSE